MLLLHEALTEDNECFCQHEERSYHEDDGQVIHQTSIIPSWRGELLSTDIKPILLTIFTFYP